MVPRADFAGTGHKVRGMAERPGDVGGPVLRREQAGLGKAGRYAPYGSDRGLRLHEDPLVHVRLWHEREAHGPRPLALIVISEPRVSWVLRVSASHAEVLQDGR